MKHIRHIYMYQKNMYEGLHFRYIRQFTILRRWKRR